MKKTLFRLKLGLATLLAVGLSSSALRAQQPKMQYFRTYDQNGIHVFETSKEDTVPFDGLKVRVGAHFTQQYQNLKHKNTAAVRMGTGADSLTNLNQLMDIGGGFNLATANLNLDAQLADGIRVNVVAYLSSRHHPETWVKGGYLQVDKLKFLNSGFIDRVMENVTLRVGHFEVNYGDQHFRRTDNGNAAYNPFVGNYIMDAFNTEIGGEVYFQKNGFIAMAAMTNGEIQGSVLRPDNRAPSLYGKIGFDKQVSDALRVRLTGSAYQTQKSLNNTLYSGDRAGSRYYFVMENTKASVAGNFTSGRINPALNNKVTAIMVNPFVKFHGLEFFGTYEHAAGRRSTEVDDRLWRQIAGEVIYRFLEREQLFVGGRYNSVNGKLQGMTSDVKVDRIQACLGWWATKNILVKGEYVVQNYRDFQSTDIRNGGKFNGFMLEGVIGF